MCQLLRQVLPQLRFNAVFESTQQKTQGQVQNKALWGDAQRAMCAGASEMPKCMVLRLRGIRCPLRLHAEIVLRRLRPGSSHRVRIGQRQAMGLVNMDLGHGNTPTLACKTRMLVAP